MLLGYDLPRKETKLKAPMAKARRWVGIRKRSLDFAMRYALGTMHIKYSFFFEPKEEPGPDFRIECSLINEW